MTTFIGSSIRSKHYKVTNTMYIWFNEILLVQQLYQGLYVGDSAILFQKPIPFVAEGAGKETKPAATAASKKEEKKPAPAAKADSKKTELAKAAAKPTAKKEAVKKAPVKSKGDASKDKALKAKKAVTKGAYDKRHRKIRTTVHFRRPKTLRLPRAPKYPRKSVAKKPRYFLFSFLKL